LVPNFDTLVVYYENIIINTINVWVFCHFVKKIKLHIGSYRHYNNIGYLILLCIQIHIQIYYIYCMTVRVTQLEHLQFLKININT